MNDLASETLSFEAMQAEGATLPSHYRTVYSVDRRLDAIAVLEPTEVVLCVENWSLSSNGGEDYYSEPLLNPTWRDVMRCAEASLDVTGDHHHVFVEGVRRQSLCVGPARRPVHHTGAPVYRILLGS